MIKNNNNKAVIIEKNFNFEKAFIDLYSYEYLKDFMSSESESRRFWYMIYRNGCSYSLKRHTNYMKRKKQNIQ